MKTFAALALLALAACATNTAGPDPTGPWCTTNLAEGLADERCFPTLAACDAFGEDRRCTHSQCYSAAEPLGGGYAGRDPKWPRAAGDVCQQAASCGQVSPTQCRQ